MGNQTNDSTLVLAKLLVGIGVVLLLAGAGAWLGPLLMHPLGRSYPVVEGLTTVGMLCFGPLALAGGLLAVLGSVLWWSYR
jgi:hypothetical protein